MKIGVMMGAGTDQDSTLEGMIQLAKRVESLGVSDLWMANIFEHDAITVLSCAESSGRSANCFNV